jgi:amidohydrolase
MGQYREKVNQLFPEMVSWRRMLHQQPELSFQEEKTAEFVYQQLSNWGIKAQKNVGGHGVVGFIEGAHPGPTVALRADMDALPIQDQKDSPYASKVSGVMHACGHDAHTSTLLGVAKLLNENRSELYGHVRLVFQHAEEVSPGGAKSMIEAGALDDVDVVYGVHLWTPLSVGKMASVAGPMMAAVDEFQIELFGKGGHAGLPHESVDSIVIGSHLVVNLQSIVSRHINPVEPCVVTVGSIQAGSSYNIIAENCVLKGTVRTFNDRVRRQIQKDIETIVEHTCSMYEATSHIEYTNSYPTVVNHKSEVNRFFETASSLFGEDSVEVSPLIMAAEDFSYYLREVPGCFIFVGARSNPDEDPIPHHHPLFDIDESAMKQAAELLIQMTLEYMKSNKPVTIE